MPKLIWGASGSKQYENGTDRGVLYLKGETGVYDDAVAWQGLTAVTESPSGGEETALYADNVKYGSLRSAEEFGGTIEAYTYPEKFAQCDGSAELADGVVIGQQPRLPFGLCYRTLIGDDENTSAGYKLHIVYNCVVAPSEKAYATVNDSPEAITFSWEFTTIPVATGVDTKPSATVVIDSTLADPVKLTALEAILYGTDDPDDGTTPRLPLPTEIATLMAPAA